MTISFKRLNHDEHQETVIQNKEEWGAELTIQQYTKREHFCRQFQHIVPYGLVLDGFIVASLEVYIRRAVVGNSTENIWSIASVFVPKQHRKKGYATLLFDKLTCLMDQYHIKSVLFSDVKYFYNKFDYRTFEGQGCVLNASNFNEKIRYLKLGDLECISKLNMINTKICEFSVINDTTVLSFPFSRELFYRCTAIKPSCSMSELNATWNFECSRKSLDITVNSNASEYKCDLMRVDHEGAVPIKIHLRIGAYTSKPDGSYGYILWTSLLHKKSSTENVQDGDIQEYKHVAILDLVTNISRESDTTESELRMELLRIAQQYAYEADIPKIVLWTYEYPKLTNTTLNDSWPAVRPKEKQWGNIKKYAWC
eukprot:NODE_139_length_17940_cov_0.254190.p5 type:complete len:368 gc:universal NODE_139_length_17940_cov_0.254190:16245-15142(-)